MAATALSAGRSVDCGQPDPQHAVPGHRFEALRVWQALHVVKGTKVLLKACLAVGDQMSRSDAEAEHPYLAWPS